jgi:hypothetical protein
MPKLGHPKPISEVVATLVDTFRHHGRGELLELVENAHFRFDEIHFDNWKGGISTWSFRLEVPVHLYAAVKTRLSAVEKEILGNLSYLDRLHPNDPVGEVTVTPINYGASALGQRMAPSEASVLRIWKEGRFRLFLSHQAKHKVEVSKIKDELAVYGISAFVAHEAIQPSLEWEREIESGLRSMHALLALMTPDFDTSSWTDQEIGWAFGRGLVVLPVRLGADPYGFAGKLQGITGNFDNPKPLAKAVFETLLANPATHGDVRRALVKEFCESGSYNQSRQLCESITKITATDFTDEEKAMMRNACTSNPQLASAFGVPEAIHKAFGTPKKEPAPPQQLDKVPF